MIEWGNYKFNLKYSMNRNINWEFKSNSKSYYQRVTGRMLIYYFKFKENLKGVCYVIPQSMQKAHVYPDVLYHAK